MAAATILGGTTVALIQCSGTVLKRRSAGVIRRKMANFFTVNPGELHHPSVSEK